MCGSEEQVTSGSGPKLPELGSPWKLDKIRDKIMKGGQKVPSNIGNRAVGKLGKVEIGNNNSNNTSTTTSNNIRSSSKEVASKVKEMFEKNSRLGSGKTRSELR